MFIQGVRLFQTLDLEGTWLHSFEYRGEVWMEEKKVYQTILYVLGLAKLCLICDELFQIM